MTLYNPEWTKQGNTYSLLSTDKVGVVQMREMRYNTCWYTYSVNSIQNGESYISGVSPGLYTAEYLVEKEMGYEFFVEMEYVMEKGCKCGSCTEPTGKWLVYNKDDTVNLLFDSEGEAIAWIIEQYGEKKKNI